MALAEALRRKSVLRGPKLLLRNRSEIIRAIIPVTFSCSHLIKTTCLYSLQGRGQWRGVDALNTCRGAHGRPTCWIGLALPGGSVMRGAGVGMQELGGLLLKSSALGSRSQGTAFSSEGSVSGMHRGETAYREVQSFSIPAWALLPGRGLPECQLELPKAGLTVISWGGPGTQQRVERDWGCLPGRQVQRPLEK